MYVEARREGPMFLERHLVAKFPKSSNMLTFPLGGVGVGVGGNLVVTVFCVLRCAVAATGVRIKCLN